LTSADRPRPAAPASVAAPGAPAVPASAAEGSPDGWTVRAAAFDAASLLQRETIFTVGNGYLAMRGAFEEGFPGDRRAMLAHGVFDAAPGVITELANLPDPLGLEVVLDGAPFRLNRGEVLAFEQELDMRSAVLRRRVRWRSEHGRAATLAFERFASLDDPHLVLLRCTITPEFDGEVEVRGWLDATSENNHPGFRIRHFDTVDQGSVEDASYLLCRTRASGIQVAEVMTVHLAADDGADGAGPGATTTTAATWDLRDHPARVIRTAAVRGRPIVVDKRIAIVTSRDDATEGLVECGIAHVRAVPSWDGALARHAEAWSAAWDDCDVEIDGDPEAQQAVRFALYHLLAAGPRHDDRVNIGAKTLSGFGYRGHAFWDTETFMLPVFTHTQPRIARNLLTSRWRQLGVARARARDEGLAGARYPWESADTGEEVTPRWIPDPDAPSRLVQIFTGELELHITADIAYAAQQYWQVTGDDDWFAEQGCEIVIAGAAFWAARAEWLEERHGFGYRDVIGPDEYHEHVDNNQFTNRMARWNLRAALDALDWLAAERPARRRTLADDLELTDEHLARWRDVAARMHLPGGADDVVEQFDGYFGLRDLDLAAMEPRSRSVQSILGVDGVQATRAVKQPDVLMAMHLLPDEFGAAQVVASYDFYAPRTDHSYGSSLGAATMAVMACRAGRVEDAYGHFLRGALLDLADARGDAQHGIHGAAAGGVWQAVAFGFVGLCLTPEGWVARPTLPAHWRRVRLRFVHRGVRQTVVVEASDDAGSKAAGPGPRSTHETPVVRATD
jgi:trehalose/maltose hydrolase-like predicted phosphorylase